MGECVGRAVASTKVGTSLGESDRVSIFSVGKPVGNSVSELEGLSVGLKVGRLEGKAFVSVKVGASLGLSDRATIISVGKPVGNSVGDLVGLSVGLNVGRLEGLSVGLKVGRLEGNTVVSVKVGASLGSFDRETIFSVG